MLSSVAQIITEALLRVFRLPELVTVFISVLPIVEARGAIPVAFSYGISPPLSWLYAFIGSSLMAPVLIAVLLPFVKWLSRTRVFRKIGSTLYDKFEKKAKGINGEGDAEKSSETATEPRPPKKDFKKMLGVFAFVAIPLPMTGVWTGSAVAAVAGLPYPKALPAVVAGNLVASGLITLLCYFLSDYMDYILLAIGIIAVAAVVALIIKIILHKSPENENSENKEND